MHKIIIFSHIIRHVNMWIFHWTLINCFIITNQNNLETIITYQLNLLMNDTMENKIRELRQKKMTSFSQWLYNDCILFLPLRILYHFQGQICVTDSDFIWRITKQNNTKSIIGCNVTFNIMLYIFLFLICAVFYH